MTDQMAAVVQAAKQGLPLYIDNSTLKAEQRCSTEVMLRYAWGYTAPEERAPLKAGTAFHALCEVHFKGGGPSEALGAFDASYREWAEANVSPVDRLAWSNLRRIVARWLALHPLAKLPFTIKPEMVEIGFAFPLTPDGDIVFCGRLDGLPEYEAMPWVLENKSTGQIKADWLDSFSLDSQLTGYLWAAGKHLGKPVVGAFLNAVEFGKLPGGVTMSGQDARRCPEHKVKYSECGDLHMSSQIVMVSRTPDQIAEWQRAAISLAKRYRDKLVKLPTPDYMPLVRMTGAFNPYNNCRLCGFKQFCKLGRPLSYIADGNLILEPWSPYDRATTESLPTAHTP